MPNVICRQLVECGSQPLICGLLVFRIRVFRFLICGFRILVKKCSKIAVSFCCCLLRCKPAQDFFLQVSILFWHDSDISRCSVPSGCVRTVTMTIPGKVTTGRASRRSDPARARAHLIFPIIPESVATFTQNLNLNCWDSPAEFQPNCPHLRVDASIGIWSATARLLLLLRVTLLLLLLLLLQQLLCCM